MKFDGIKKAFSLPEEGELSSGIKCCLCARECLIPEGKYGYCGLRRNERGRLIGPSFKEGRVSWYLDPLPTNCVADWICPGGCGTGYPDFAYKPGPEDGYYNLAVFFEACNLNCLYCQNWHFKYETFNPRYLTLEEFLEALNPLVSCICYFGGDPGPQAPFAIKASREALGLPFLPQVLFLCLIMWLPLVSKEMAFRALGKAKRAHLKRVSLGNEHLLR